MKLKSKLIATIVSICAAIAVMGVGVWAATESFTVTVTNTVNISVANLSGTVDVEATATKNGSQFIAPYEETILDTVNGPKDEAFAIDGTVWGGAYLLGKTGETANIDADTTEAVLTYTFTFTPAGAGAGKITAAITNVTLVEATGAKIEYTYSINGAEAVELTAAGASQAINATVDPITVTVTATYTNEKLVSATASGDFIFAVSFTPSAA